MYFKCILESDFEPTNSYNVRLLSRATLALSLQKTADFYRTEAANSTAMSGSMSGLDQAHSAERQRPFIASERNDRSAARPGATGGVGISEDVARLPRTTHVASKEGLDI